MDDQELRLACIEAAADAPIIHAEGPAVGVIKTANLWYLWIKNEDSPAADSISSLV